MKKGVKIFLFGFILFGMMLNYAHFAIAEDDNNPAGENLSANEQINNSDNQKETEQETNFTDEHGENVSIRVHHNEGEQGNLTIEQDDFEDEDGNNISIINREDGKGNHSNGEFDFNGVKAKSELKLDSSFDNNKTEINADFGNKNETIKIMPDEASQIALKALADKGFTLRLIAVGKGNEVKAVYSAELDQTGKILGLIPVTISSTALIDSQTGKVTDLNQPWWGFIVTGKSSIVK